MKQEPSSAQNPNLIPSMPISDSHSFTQNPLPSFNSTVNTSVMGSRHPLPDLNSTPTTSDDDVDFTVPQPVLHVTPSASNADVGFTVPQLDLSATHTTSQPPLLLELDPVTGAIGPSLDIVLQMNCPLVPDEIATLIIHSDAERLYYRKAVRQTRMIFDALRIRLEAEQKLCPRGSPVCGHRPELSASRILKTCGRWFLPHHKIVGSIPGVYVGDLFFYRAELSVLGLHHHNKNCVDFCRSASTNWQVIATAIVYNEEKGTDYGDVIIYSADGGQVEENEALTRSMKYGIDVRVIRRTKIYKKGAAASTMHYSYDGLYKVANCSYDKQMPGFMGKFVCKLVRIPWQPQKGSEVLNFAHSLIFKPLDTVRPIWRPMGNLREDISFGTEVVPVKLFNDVDANLDPYSYLYTREPRFEPIFQETKFPPYYYMYFQRSYGTGPGCNCQTDDCDEGCMCKVRNGGQCPYNLNGFLLRGKPVVYECGITCKCPPSCRYRVSQRGLRTSLEVYRSREMGSEISWGVRSMESIKAGEFICEYAGAILPILPGVKGIAFSLNNCGSSMIYPQQFADKWAEWGDLSSIYRNDKRPTFPEIPPLDYAIDTSRLRNVASYVRHSSTPNVMVQFVCFDNNNLVVPHLMLFAVENIPPMTPLCLDYGVAVADE